MNRLVSLIIMSHLMGYVRVNIIVIAITA